MKRLFIILAAAMMAVGAMAENMPEAKQNPVDANKESALFIGGTGTFGYDGVFNFGIEPIVGYDFTDRWAIGSGIGMLFAASGKKIAAMGIVEPFVRLCAWHNDIVYIDFKATAGIGFTDELLLCQAGIRPSLRFRLNENWDFAADFGLFGAQYSVVNGWLPTFGITPTSAGLWFSYRFK